MITRYLAVAPSGQYHLWARSKKEARQKFEEEMKEPCFLFAGADAHCYDYEELLEQKTAASQRDDAP